MRMLGLQKTTLAAMMVALSSACGGGDAVTSTSASGSAEGSSTAGGSSAGGSGSGSADSGSGGGSGGSSSGQADSSGGSSSGGSSDTSSGSTTAEPCGSDAECDDGNPCSADHCGAGFCSHDAINGQPAPTGQTDGDCQVILCINGISQSTNSDNDVPDDGNVCTDDLCMGGVPSNPDFPAGTPCNQVGVCDGNGACSECISPDDCDQFPVDDDCQMRTCEANTCGQVFTDADTEIGMQVPADCHVVVCDGAGGTVANVDDADVPDDGLECTVDSCDAGVPSNDPVPAGTPCLAGLCDGQGGCVGCLDPGDCGGVDTFCRTYTCTDGECGVDDTPDGTPLPAADQTDHDCQQLQCDGNGNIVAVPDDTDVPVDDGNDCTDEVCNGGNPDHPDLPIDTDCSSNGGQVCDGAGTCVECNSDGQCPSGPQCNQAACNAHVCELEATPGVACNDGAFCTSNDTCNALGACVGGGDPCPGPDGDSNCAETCNEATDSCTGNDANGAACSDGLFCTTGDVCDGAGTCQGGGNPCAANVGDNDNDCTESCNEGTDSCINNDPNGSACNDGSFCTATDTCTNGVCGGTGNPCAALIGDNDSDCSENCNEAADNCTSNDPNGSACNDGLFCTVTDTCTGGVCGGTGNPCTANVGDNDSDCSESCNEATNNCTTNDPNGSSCNDGLFCTATDTCTGGVCGGTGNPCTANVGDNDSDCSESCNEATNNCTTNDPNGSSCNDGLFCTATDTCTGGVCGGTGNPCPGPDNDNNCGESCNETTNNCTASDPNGSACADGLFCTHNDTCSNGTCVGGPDPCPGPDGDTDCSESCNEAANNCSTDDPNGSACDVSCFINGSCLNGGCVTVCP
ncbi:MAG: hypothetical protein K1X88_19455 [Nannocystaceae bacterium]|nr:hypothetical protein [Nannocystaceae bacterium]